MGERKPTGEYGQEVFISLNESLKTIMKNHRTVDLKTIAGNAMMKYGFEPFFPNSVLREVSAINVKTFPDKEENSKDLSMLLWSSIDNSDSMDLDQMEFAGRGQNGEIEVKIAIADVDLYVRKHSQADQHAAHNGTSVYTGIETFPMLPDKLSKGITSLLPGQDHMAIVTEYIVLPDGDVRHGDIYWYPTRQNSSTRKSETGWTGLKRSPNPFWKFMDLKNRFTCKAKQHNS
jgi:ribonuclease R